MKDTAAHLVEKVFAQVPVRQWVLSFPKRLRYFLALIPICSITYLGFFLTVWIRRCNHAVRIRQTLSNNYCKISLSRTSFVLDRLILQ